jgi:S1-C subfamily serine protease
MGYPSHAGFGNFVTATLGAIAAVEESYLYKHELILLTSKVKGGNSGGPVINKRGYAVGIVTETPAAEGDAYDKFGYGLAIPIKYINEILMNGSKLEENINFV